jgi:hypothetical protein
MATFDQTKYIESTKAVIKEYTRSLFPDYDIPLALPDLGDDNLKLKKPVIFIEFNNSNNLDLDKGRNNGRGGRLKRKTIRYSFQVLTTGENSAILDRDRIAQKLEYEFSTVATSQYFAAKGMKDVDLRYMNSYRVREGVHLARLELFAQISFMN